MGVGALPRVLFAAGDLATGCKALVLQDVYDGIQAGRLFGPGSPLNWGVSPPLLDEAVLAEEVTREAFLLAARLHAAFWGDESLLSSSFLRDADALSSEGSLSGEAWARAQATAARGWAAAEQAETPFPPLVVAVVRASLSRVDSAAYVAQCAARRASGTLRACSLPVHDP